MPDFTPTENRRHVNLTIIIDDDLSVLGMDTKRYKAIERAICFENDCVIWVPSIDSLDDANFRAWGKAAAHLYYGDYHGTEMDIY